MNKTFIAVTAGVLLCAIIISAGCISGTEKTEVSLDGTWQLEENPAVTLTFSSDGTFSGEAQVNLYNGTYTADGTSLSLGDGINRTKRMGPAAEMDAEDAYLNALTLVSSCKEEGGRLILSDKDGRTLLTFVRENAPAGEEESLPLYRTWTLDDSDSVTLTFETDGKYSGYAPVNSYGGTFTAGEKTADGRTPLALGAAFSTLMAGAPEDMEAEDAYYAALRETDSYAVTAGTPLKLELFGKDGKLLLSFTAKTEKTKPLTTGKRMMPYGTWILEKNMHASITFDEDGTYSGYTPAVGNSYSGTYMVYGPSAKPSGEYLEMSPAVSTKMAGSPAANKEETEFFAALKKVTDYSIVSADGNGGTAQKLELLDKNGDVLLTFVKFEE